MVLISERPDRGRRPGSARSLGRRPDHRQEPDRCRHLAKSAGPRYQMLFGLPDGKTAEAVRIALTATVQQLPDHLWKSLNHGIKAKKWHITPRSSIVTGVDVLLQGSQVAVAARF